MGVLKIETRSTVPRKLRSQYTQASNAAWADTGEEFHSNYRERRFTKAHATAARYSLRSGERGTEQRAKGFKRTYTGKKLQRYGHTRPLEFTGETRRAIFGKTIRTTSKGVKVAYPGARRFNLRHSVSTFSMADEFRRIIPTEETTLAKFYAERLAIRFKGK